jgi:hypothetical protein
MTGAAAMGRRIATRRPGPTVPVVGALMAALTVIAGAWIKARGGRLGVPTPPFYIRWQPRISPLAAVSIGVLAVAAASTASLARSRIRPLLFAACLFALALALDIGLNIARGGAHELWAVFQIGPHRSREGPQEYLPGLWALARGVPYYVSHFPALIPRLPVHVRGNPPGPLVAMHLLGIVTAPGLAALCIGVGALSAPLTYVLGRTLGGEALGRVAGVLSAFAPGLLLLGATSADYAFTTLGLGAACLLVRESRRARLAGALLAAAASLFSWLLLAIPAWSVVVVARREGPRRAIELAFACALVMAALYAVLALSVGYDPLGALQATSNAYHSGIARVRPYAYWLFGSPVAWGVALGLPIAFYALRALGDRDAAALALAAVVVTSAVLGLTKAETERIWLPFAPLACVAAAAATPHQRLRATVWLLAAQALAVELLFDTVW